MGGGTGSWRAVGERGQWAESKENTKFKLWNVDSFGGLVFRGGEAPTSEEVSVLSQEKYSVFSLASVAARRGNCRNIAGWLKTRLQPNIPCSWLQQLSLVFRPLMAWHGRVTCRAKIQWCWQMLWLSFGAICTREHNWLFLDNCTWITSNCYPNTEVTSTWDPGATYRVRSMQSEQLGQIVTISITQNTILGKNITASPYTTTKKSRRTPEITSETSRRVALCWFAWAQAAQKLHLLTPHSSSPSSRQLRHLSSTCSYSAISLGLAISGWYF